MDIKKKDKINKTHTGDDGLKNNSFVTSCLANNETGTVIAVVAFVEKYKHYRITFYS